LVIILSRWLHKYIPIEPELPCSHNTGQLQHRHQHNTGVELPRNNDNSNDTVVFVTTDKFVKKC